MTWVSLLLPWHPSVSVMLLSVGAAWLYVRGCRGQRVGAPRQLYFWVGLVVTYASWQTQLEYYAERQFFMHRIQQLLLRDVGPFLIAFSAPWAVWGAGVPERVRRWFQPLGANRALRAVWRGLTSPALNFVLFLGLEWLWLVPEVHFAAMLDLKIYRLMNWSMLADGLLFWSLVLDGRRSPPARWRPGTRLLVVALVMPFEMAPGILLTFTPRNLYPLYELCGRAFAGISTHDDQTLGGLVIWIIGSLMNLFGALAALYSGFFSDAADAEGPEARTIPRPS